MRRRDSDQDRLADFAAIIKHETPRAYLLSDGVREAWFPKSVTENNRDGTFTVPEWMAKKEGFI